MGCSQEKPAKKNVQRLTLNNKNQKNKSEIKVVFLGDAGVGKSSVAQRYCYNKFNDGYEVTIGGVYHRRDVQLKSGSTLTLHLWDTGGEERFRAMAPLYYRDANAAILVYDVQDQKTFESLNFWLKELDDKVKSEGLVLCIAGNKCDVDESLRRVSKAQGQAFATQNDLIFFETSAFKDEGIQNLFTNLSEMYAKRKLN